MDAAVWQHEGAVAPDDGFVAITETRSGELDGFVWFEQAGVEEVDEVTRRPLAVNGLGLDEVAVGLAMSVGS